ncbi:MAG: DUF2973 domain-containing protein [Okeania sp. SIO2H7]|nr:DUF2973 domain-containing protein [Okeania sp. SIO2H7]
MLHLLYILAFTTIAVLAVVNLIRSLFVVGIESQRTPPKRWSADGPYFQDRGIPHPELLDETGNVIDEPLLVMRSLSVQEAREQLDALYDSEPGSRGENRGESEK